MPEGVLDIVVPIMRRGEHVSRETQPPETDPARPNGDVSTLTIDELFEVLSNKRRRYAFYYLLGRDGTDPVDVTALSSQAAAWELDTDPEEITYADRKNVHTSLAQFHLHKMDELGLVEYDADERTVRLTEAGADLDLYGRGETDGGVERWSGFLLLVAGATVLFTGGAWLDVPVLAVLPDGAVGLAGAGVFLLAAAAFWYYARTAPTRRLAPVLERPDRQDDRRE
jgi:hypothetical protein